MSDPADQHADPSTESQMRWWHPWRLSLWFLLFGFVKLAGIIGALIISGVWFGLDKLIPRLSPGLRRAAHIGLGTIFIFTGFAAVLVAEAFLKSGRHRSFPVEQAAPSDLTQPQAVQPSTPIVDPFKADPLPSQPIIEPFQGDASLSQAPQPIATDPQLEQSKAEWAVKFAAWQRRHADFLNRAGNPSAVQAIIDEMNALPQYEQLNHDDFLSLLTTRLEREFPGQFTSTPRPEPSMASIPAVAPPLPRYACDAGREWVESESACCVRKEWQPRGDGSYGTVFQDCQR